MPLLIVGIGILILLLLISKFKINAFLALLITSFAVGLLSSMNPLDILDSVLKGVGDTMGKIVLILAFGAMLGKILEESGAAHTITFRMIDFMGLKNIQYALLITGFLVGLPMMYNASFLVLIPLIFTFASTTKLPTIWLALPLCSALSVAHCFLPPHPAPTYVSFIYEADVNKVLLYGLVPMIPACLIGGVWLSRFTKNIVVTPPKDLFEERKFEKSELPGLGISVFCAVTPIMLMLLGALTDVIFGPPPAKAELTQMGIDSISGFYQHIFTGKGFSAQSSNVISGILTFFKFMSDANIALFMAVIVAILTLGLRKGRKMDDVMNISAKSIGAISMIILIIAGGGAFSQVLKDSHVIEYIRSISSSMQMNPLLMAFLISSIFRLATGSATVASLTTAPIMLPMAQQMGTSPELMVLATGAGSVMWSHFNDSGFWMFKEYFGLSIKQTFQTWTVMESTVGIVGIVTVMIMSVFI
ncbi:MAG: SLC13 family permease [Prolixibacteraceae bacterium]|nr:SLC13 family permease [Prolixibacteraceae bacterium]